MILNLNQFYHINQKNQGSDNCCHGIQALQNKPDGARPFVETPFMASLQRAAANSGTGVSMKYRLMFSNNKYISSGFATDPQLITPNKMLFSHPMKLTEV